MKRLKIIALLVIAVALATVVIQNTGPVQTRLLWVTVEMPLVLLLLLTALAGFCLGLLVSVLPKAKGG
jgi:uncharacterized integral membrane protein